MIVVRNVFELHFGKAREALAVLAERQGLEMSTAMSAPRVLTDLTGAFYTVVLEFSFESLAAFEQDRSSVSPQWRDWYAKFTPLVRAGRREIYRVVEPS